MRFLKKIILKNKLKTGPLKIILGAGNTKYPEWVSTNRQLLDITNESDFEYYFRDNLVENFLLEHVIEHLEYDDFIKFLTLSKKYMKEKGCIRIAVPDANHPSLYVRELTGVNGTEPGADDHKFFYSITDMENIAEMTGFKLLKLEYFDNRGYFNSFHYDDSNGYISRCSKNYHGRFDDNRELEKMIESTPFELQQQFKDLQISYTSLLVDFINE